MTTKIQRLTPSDFYALCRPSRCNLRIYLRDKGIEEAPPGAFDEVIRILGQRHENEHLQTFPSYVDLSSGTEEQRESRTREEVGKGAAVIYQALLRTTTDLDGRPVEGGNISVKRTCGKSPCSKGTCK